jgi:hypothetical protein
MDSGAGTQPRQPDHGRHRRVHPGGAQLSGPTPRPGSRPAHARPLFPARRGMLLPCDEPTIPLPPVTDPLVDTDAVGLRKFNLGTVPASVTPPKTWRRAAWFSVGSSVAALVALLVLGALLVGPSRLRTQIESLPGKPFDVPLPTTTPTGAQLLPGNPSAIADRTHTGGTPTGHATTTGTVSTTPIAPPAGGGTLRVPTIATVPGVTNPVVDPGKVAQQTQQFFAAVSSNVKQAYGLTGGALKADGEAALQQRYQDVATVQVQGITIDPGKGTTIDTVLVTKKDGSTTTEQHVLAFTTGSLPLISGDITN